MKPCDHECLIISCVLLAVFVVMQTTILAFTYGGVMDDDRLRTSIQSYTTVYNRSEARRLPSVLIIGVRKGGTRALLDAMALHPNIRVVRRRRTSST